MMIHSTVYNVVIHMDLRGYFSFDDFNDKKLTKFKYGLNVNTFCFQLKSFKDSL